jgi:hypothetical protein
MEGRRPFERLAVRALWSGSTTGEMVEVRALAPWSVIRLGWWLVAAVLVWGVVGCDQGQPAADPVDPDVGPSTTVEVEVFFANPDLGDPCGEVFPVIREVDADDPVVGALEALLAGPTAAEQAQGYGGWFSQDTVEMLLDVEVVDATVRVVFKDLRLVIPNASSSCGSAGLLAQLDATLLAFDHLGSTRYALADQAAFYEWLQLADPDTTPPEQATEPDDGPANRGLTIESLESVIATEFGRSLAPRSVTIACDHDGTIGRGDLTVCSVFVEPTSTPEPDWGRVVAAVLDDDGRVAWSYATSHPTSTVELRNAFSLVPTGLFCRDLLSDDVPGPFGGTRAPADSLFWSVVYWNLEGQPARMDADGNGIPCESLYDAEVVSSVVSEFTPDVAEQRPRGGR